MKKHSDKHDIEKLLEIMATLRDPAGGCPWDREQTFATIAPYTIEEAYEVADAIERGALAELEGRARRPAVPDRLPRADGGGARAVRLRRRGPRHLRQAAAPPPARVRRRARRRRGASRAGSGKRSSATSAARPARPACSRTCRPALPGLSRAAKLGKRAATVGFDWPDVAGVRAKLREELAELDAALAVAGEGAFAWPRQPRTRRTPPASAPPPTPPSRPRSATCCSRSRICAAISTSTPRRACAARTRASRSASTMSRRRCRRAGGDWSKHDAAALEHFWEAAKSATR